jgi:hypothetical protein
MLGRFVIGLKKHEAIRDPKVLVPYWSLVALSGTERVAGKPLLWVWFIPVTHSPNVRVGREIASVVPAFVPLNDVVHRVDIDEPASLTVPRKVRWRA